MQNFCKNIIGNRKKLYNKNGRELTFSRSNKQIRRINMDEVKEVKEVSQTSEEVSKVEAPVVKRGRGRPKGSKNKPKSIKV